MVSEMRVPSSSSSSSNGAVSGCPAKEWGVSSSTSRTNRKRLDLDALFDVRVGSIVGFLMLEDRLAAERVDEGGPACSDAVSLEVLPRSASRMKRTVAIPVPEAPHTIRQN